MDMQTLVSFLNSDYKKYKRKVSEHPEVQEALDYLTMLVGDYGIPFTRTKLDHAGVTTVPQLVMTLDGKFAPRSLTAKVEYNGAEGYVLLRYPMIVDNVKYTRPADLVNYIGRNMDGFHCFENETTRITYTLTSGRTHSLRDIINHGYECPTCGSTQLDRHWDEWENIEYECPICRADNQPYQYSTKVEEILGYEDTKETRFGIELEYEGVKAKQVKKLLSHYALPKADGSINNGVEIVTKPACMATHKKELRLLFNNIKTESHYSTGMHVHIEKAKLSEYQIGFMLEFLNKEDLTPHIEKIAGRNYKDNHYCKTDKYATMTKGLFWDKRLMRNETDKYTTINTRKKHTVEIRIFASPESYMECVARLEFVEGLVLFSSPYSMSVKSLRDKFKWETFEHYMQTNKKHFPYFNCMYLA